MEKVCGIYKITSPSGKIYIGQSKDINKRWRGYKRCPSRGQVLLYRSIKKHGILNHKLEVLQKCSHEELDELEKYYINLFSTFNSPNGLNLKHGGVNGVLSKESRIKISKTLMGHSVPENVRLKISLALSGIPMPQDGKDKRSKTQKGRIVSAEIGRKISNSKMGHLVSIKTRLKISEALSGKSFKRKTILNIETGIYYSGTLEASIAANVSVSSMWRMIKVGKLFIYV